MKLIAVIALSVLLTSGCAMLGPDYQKSDAPVGTSWLEIGVPRISSEPLIDTRRWESAHAQQQDPLSATQGSVATNLVEVYKALGGGWEIRADQDPVDRLPAAMKDEMRGRTRTWKGVLQ